MSNDSSRMISVDEALEKLHEMKDKGINVLLIDDYSSSLARAESIDVQEVYHSDGEYWPDTSDLDEYEALRAAVLTLED